MMMMMAHVVLHSKHFVVHNIFSDNIHSLLLWILSV